MIVVDSNIVAYLYLPGERTADAEALLEQDPEWAAHPHNLAVSHNFDGAAKAGQAFALRRV